MFVILGDVRGSGLVLKVVSQGEGEDHVYICLFGNKLKSLEVRNRKLPGFSNAGEEMGKNGRLDSKSLIELYQTKSRSLLELTVRIQKVF